MKAQEAVSRLLDLCEALKPWHERGLTYGALCPEALQEDGALRAPDSPAPPAYRGPLRGQKGDLYALGVCLYHWLRGEFPCSLAPPALQPTGLDAVVCQLLAGGYSHLESLIADLRGSWDHPDFVAAAAYPKKFSAFALVGRERELQELEGRLLSRGSPTLVVAPAGTGKSSLLVQLARRLRARGLAVWSLRCQSSDLLRPFESLALQLAERMQNDEEFARRLLPFLRPLPLAGLLPALSAWCAAVQEEWPEEFLMARSSELLVQFCTAVAMDGALLVEDLHAAPPELHPILTQVAEQVALVATSREAHAGFTVLDLPALSESQIHDLVRSRCGPTERAISDRIAALSEGNPLLAACLVRHYKEAGQFAWGQVCQSGEALLRERIAGLPGLTRRFLGMAALQGMEFQEELLPRGARPHLERAQDLGMLMPVEAGWQFTHELFRREFESALSAEERTRGHEELAQHHLNVKCPSVEQVAHHLAASDDPRTAAWCARAAQEARARGDLARAEAFDARAGEAEPVFSRLFDWAEIQRLRGRWDEALNLFHRALGLASEALDRARTLGKMGETLWRSGRLPEASSCFVQALEQLGLRVPERGWSRRLALAQELLGLAWPMPTRRLSATKALRARLLDQLAYTSAYHDGLGLIWANLRSLRETAGAHEDPERAVVLASHAVAVVNVPSLVARSLRCIAQARRIADRYCCAHEQHCTLSRESCILLFVGRLEEAAEVGERALSWLRSSGDRYDVGICGYNLALCHYWLGNWERAHGLAHQGWSEACKTGDWLAEGYCGRVLAALGHFPSPPQQLPEDHPHIEMLRWERAGVLQLSRHRPGLAVEPLEQALSRARALNSSIDVCWIALWLVRAYRQEDERAPLAQRSRYRSRRQALLAMVLRCARRAYRPFLAPALRELAWLQSNGTLFQESEAVAHDLGQVHEEVLALGEMVQAGFFPQRRAEARSKAAALPASWQRPELDEAALDHQLLARRLERLLHHGTDLLSCLSQRELLAQIQIAATRILDLEGCEEVEQSVEQPALMGQDLLLGTGVGTALRCRSQPGSALGSEELHLARFLQALVQAAVRNLQRLEQSRQYRERLDHIFRALPVGIATLDETGRVLSGNPALETMLGAGLEGTAFAEYVHFSDRAAFRTALAQILAGEATGLRQEIRYLGVRQNLVWGEVSLTRLAQSLILVGVTDASSGRLERIAAFQENERRLLSSELHDVSQPLVGLGLHLRAMGAEEASATVQRLLEEMRSVMFELRSPVLGSFSLKQSLSDAMLESAHMAGLELHLELDELLETESLLVALFAYRIVIEAMTNVRKHAQAKRVLLRVCLRADSICGSLVDDGIGPAQIPARMRFGLKGIQDRAEILGGWARIRRFRNYTLLHFRLPAGGRN